MCTKSEKADFPIVWSYKKKRLSEYVISEKAFSGHVRSGFLVPYQKSRFLISFSNSIRSAALASSVVGTRITNNVLQEARENNNFVVQNLC